MKNSNLIFFANAQCVATTRKKFAGFEPAKVQLLKQAKAAAALPAAGLHLNTPRTWCWGFIKDHAKNRRWSKMGEWKQRKGFKFRRGKYGTTQIWAEKKK